MTVAPDHCVRVVPSKVKEGALEDWLAAHRQHHSPAVRRQPGFVSKLLFQSEDNPIHVAMLLVWETNEQALAWTKHPEHDVVSAPVGAFADRSAGRVEAMPRGSWRVLEVIGPQA